MKRALIAIILCAHVATVTELDAATQQRNQAESQVEFVMPTATTFDNVYGCATCLYSYDPDDCQSGPLGPECWEVWHMGEDCLVPPGHEDGCYRCQTFWPGTHEDCSSINEEYREGYQYLDWSSYACPNVQACDDPPHEALVQEALAYLDAGDAQSLSLLLVRSQGRIVLNQERQALQAFGCGKTIDTHVVVGDALFAALNELDARKKRHSGISIPIFAALGIAGVLVRRRR